ncbi:hypothetical protein ACFPN1_14010 [Lysobacter yangpyeongensis]|jgi:DNA-binding IclR family transcriptional regulator|uniref:MarR family transcriptional regulator n=1 Tax=Lysobacter yangpyeongensis TaxID=346182 RepID=A0ABW0SRE2_9GAMM
MSRAVISPAIRRFISAKLVSVPFWEGILLLRSRPGMWTADELAARLYINGPTARQLVGELQRSGFAAADQDGIRYAPHPDLAEMVEQLAGLYSRHVVEVTKLIHASADRRAENFANAFVLRRDE